jgi:hypothetical protein
MEAAMMGRRVIAELLFYTSRLEDHVPTDYPLLAVDTLLDTAFIQRVKCLPTDLVVGRY